MRTRSPRWASSTPAHASARVALDSGTVAGGSQFPNVDINLAVNGFYCNDRAFFLHCKPQ